jgi:hypothetical protein
VTQYAVRRALTLLPVLLGVSIFVFSFIHLIFSEGGVAPLRCLPPGCAGEAGARTLSWTSPEPAGQGR